MALCADSALTYAACAASKASALERPRGGAQFHLRSNVLYRLVTSVSRNRGQPRFRDLSREAPSGEEVNALTSMIANGPHLVSAILGASLLEYQLERIIRRRIAKMPDSAWNQMTAENGPLGSFYQKIILAVSLGIIDDAMATNLKLVQIIRNVFAHAKKIVTFDHALATKELSRIAVPSKRASKLGKAIRQSQRMSNNREKYVALCLVIAGELVRAETRSLKASTRNISRKKITQSYGPLAAYGLALPSHPVESLGALFHRLGNQGLRTGDPSLQEGLLNPSVSIAEIAKLARK